MYGQPWLRANGAKIWWQLRYFVSEAYLEGRPLISFHTFDYCPSRGCLCSTEMFTYTARSPCGQNRSCGPFSCAFFNTPIVAPYWPLRGGCSVAALDSLTLYHLGALATLEKFSNTDSSDLYAPKFYSTFHGPPLKLWFKTLPCFDLYPEHKAQKLYSNWPVLIACETTANGLYHEPSAEFHKRSSAN